MELATHDCPYCGNKTKHAGYKDYERSVTIWCGHCKREFVVRQHITFTTHKIDGEQEEG